MQINNIPKPVALSETPPALVILDQTLLPGRTEFLHLTNVRDIWESIKNLRVRGAPAIGIAAAIGVYAVAANSGATDISRLKETVDDTVKYLKTSRPTAVNLFWALERMHRRFNEGIYNHSGTAELLKLLRDEALLIQSEDEANCRKIGEYGLSLLTPGTGILTHCNAGILAASKYGTALAPLYVGQEKGIYFDIYTDETRPLHQGSRLTAWELSEAGLSPTLICDNMAASLMQSGKISAVLTGCDRAAINGDTANKIGTLPLAVNAKYFDVPFYVCTPVSSIDPACKSGKEIEIELRDGSEITEKWFSLTMAPENVKTFNPCFDVTPNELITAFITEHGVIYPKYSENLSGILL